MLIFPYAIPCTDVSHTCVIGIGSDHSISEYKEHLQFDLKVVVFSYLSEVR